MNAMEKYSDVYILASDAYGTLYTGVTSNLVKRIWQHRSAIAEGFTKRYRVDKLVWYEMHFDIMEAIKREKQIKKWRRNWKVNLVQAENPTWRDLYLDFTSD